VEIAEEVAKRVGPKPRQRLLSGFGFFLDQLCQGPPQGTKVTFARPDQWIDGWREMDEQDALLEVCRRYLRAYGPARPTDFQEWIGGRAFRPAHSRAVFDTLGDELEEIDVEGHRAHVLAGDTTFPSLKPAVRLLPEYDVYVMGFREREHLVPEAVRQQLAAHSRGRYEGPAGVRFVLVDGVAAGLWERKKRGKRLELRIAPTRRPTKAQRAELDTETERIAAFTGLAPAVSVV
jgi:DNA glycosylase AlkZ-like